MADSDTTKPIPLRSERNIFQIDNPEEVCKINPLIDKRPIDTFARIEAVLAMVQDIEVWRNAPTADSAAFTMMGTCGFHSVLDATKGALDQQVSILYRRAKEFAEGEKS